MALTQISTKGIKDGTITGTDLATNIDLVDSQKLRLGTGNDLQIYHNGSNSYIEETGTGILGIQSSEVQIGNASSNKVGAKFFQNAQVELYYDNSKKFETTSAGVTVTGALAATSLSATGGITGTGGNFILGDSSGTSDDRIKLGASQDLQIYHDGTDNLISTSGTVLAIHRATTNASNPVFEVRSNHGATNQIKFQVDGDGDVLIPTDTGRLQLGASQDLQIFHNGTHSFMENSTGILAIRSDSFQITDKSNNHAMITATADGAVELYYDNSKKFETVSWGASLTGTLVASSNIKTASDTGKLMVGAGDDLQIYHDGSNSYIQDAGTGSLYIKSSAQLYLQSYGGETFLKADANGAVELYHNNSKKFETTSYGNLSAAQVRVASSNATTVGFSLGDVGTGFYNSGSNAIGYSANGTQKWNINSAGDLNLADNVKGIFGDGLDLQLYHDGTNSLIDNNTGNLYINSAGEIYLCPNNNEAGVYVRANGAVELYYDNSKKFETTSSGVDITGTLQTTGDTTLGRDYSTNPSNVLTGVTTIRGHCVNTGTTDNDFAQLYLRNSSSSGNSSASIRGFRDDSNYKTGLRFYTHNSNSSGGDGDERMRIDSSGSVRIAHDSFTADTSADDLIVGSTTSGINRGITILNHTGQDGRLCFAQSGDPDAGMIKYSHGSDVMQFFVESDEKMRIASDGNVGIGKSSSSLDVDGSIFIGSGQGMNMVKSGSGGKIITLNRRTNVGLSIEFYRGSSVGSISHNNTSTAYNTTSDYRLKENVVSLSDAITRLKTLKPYRFNFIADKDTTVDGFLAHEVTAVPEAIQGEKDAVITQEMIDNEDYEKERLGEILPQGIDQAKLVPLLVAAVQEAIGKIEVLETEVAVLKAS